MQAAVRRLGSLAQQQCRNFQTATATVVSPVSKELPMPAANKQSTKIEAMIPDMTKRMVQVRWSDGKVGNFPFVWLRDSAPLAIQPVYNPKCIATAATRTLTLNELNVQVKPEKLALDPQGESIVIQWPPYNEVAYRSDWLREHLLTIPGLTGSEKLVTLWGRADLDNFLPQATAEELSSGNKKLLRQKLSEFAKYGILMVHGGGTGDLKALKALGYQLDQLEPNKFRAYPHHVQGIHTGGAYKPAIPPVCLLFIREEPEDNTLQICDGYRIADQLRKAHPTLFTFLCNTLIEYKVMGKDGTLKSHKWPVFTLAANGAVQQVIFNNALRSSRITVPPDTLEDYYKALKTFNSYCYQTRNMYNLHVQKGDLVLIANQRILHGNPAFSDNVNTWVDEVFLSDEPLTHILKQAES